MCCINMVIHEYSLFLFFSSSYQNNDINEFEKILKTNRRNIMEDPFIREHIEGKYFIIFFITNYVCHVSVCHIESLN